MPLPFLTQWSGETAGKVMGAVCVVSVDNVHAA